MNGPRRAAGWARREAVIELWYQGRPTAVIAATLGLTVATVQTEVQSFRNAKPNAAPLRRPGPLAAAQCAKICALKAEGWTQAAIARFLGINRNSVYKVLRSRMAEATSDGRPVVGAIGSQIVTMWEAGYTARAIADRFALGRIQYVYEVIGRIAPEVRLRRQKERSAREQNMLQQVAALRRKKRSNREIAHELGITLPMVQHFVRRGQAAGTIERRNRVVTNAQSEEIIALRAAGISGREIARRVNLSYDTVYSVLHHAGISPRARRRELEPKILALWEAGWKSDGIADVCGTTAAHGTNVAPQS